nr:Imm74 family immunity protein [Streptomyces sp. SID13031]
MAEHTRTGSGRSAEGCAVEIVDAARGHLQLELKGRTATVYGEFIAVGDVDYYIDRASITRWDDGPPMSIADQEFIVQKLPEVATRSGLRLVID